MDRGAHKGNQLPSNSSTDNKRFNSSSPLAAADAGADERESDPAPIIAARATIAKVRDMIDRGGKPPRVRFEDRAGAPQRESASGTMG